MAGKSDPQALSRRSDAAQTARLVARVLATVHNVVGRVLGRGDAEHDDIVQTALEQLLALFAREAAHDDRFARRWAAIVARNVAVDALRARSRERRVLSRTGDASATQRPCTLDPERIAAARESLLRFAAALGGLRLSSAQVVFMHDALGYSLSEIAESLGISVAAAQSRLVRGRRRIPTEADAGEENASANRLTVRAASRAEKGSRGRPTKRR